MKKSVMLAAVAVASLVATPVLANPAASLSVAKATRAASPSGKKSQLAAPGGIIAAVLVAGVVAGGIIIAVDDDDDDDSDSN